MKKDANEKYTNQELLLMGHSRDLDLAVAHNRKIDIERKITKILIKNLKIGISGFSGEQQIYGIINSVEEIGKII